MKEQIIALCKHAKQASYGLMGLSSDHKDQFLVALKNQLHQQRQVLLNENQKDVKILRDSNASSAFLDRLKLDDDRLNAIIASIEIIRKLPDPVGRILQTTRVPSGLEIKKLAVPLGVLAVIYESRPNVTIDAAALGLKSGNAVILRAGKDSFHTVQLMNQLIKNALLEVGLSEHCITCLPYKERQAVDVLIKQQEYIDVLIPRGGTGLIRYLNDNSKIPLFMHLSGLCHTYLHKSAELEMAKSVVANAKMRRTGICGATETLLVDKGILETHMPSIISWLLEQSCELRGDQQICKLDSRVQFATEEDWQKEYLAPILSIKTVETLKDAIDHINTYGSHHTDAIIAEDEQAVRQFMQNVDSAIVMHNASTQFADGGEFGMGAEMGIATGKLHARGPVGLEQLTTFKYQVFGNGTVRPR